jgi:hypothetical protein
MVTVISYLWLMAVALSNGYVRHTRVVVVEDCGMHGVLLGSLNVMTMVLCFALSTQ